MEVLVQLKFYKRKMSANKDLINTVDFNFIRYANCWEDADVLLHALEPKAGDNILSIASAGDNSFAFLATDGVHVHAVDINETQIHLCEFKKTAIVHLSYNEFLNLMGFTSCNNRWQIFNSIQNYLPSKTRSWCLSQQKQIEDGIIYKGKFEKYFENFRKYILPLIHSKQTYIDLLQPKNDVQQKEFYTKTFNNWRWRFLFKIFFSKFVMGRAGRDPEFLKQVNLNVSNYIYNKASEHLSLEACTQNYFLHFIFTGNFSNNLPYYIRPENFANIKRNIKNITFGIGFIQDATIAKPNLYNKANLSNIFEYMSTEVFTNIAKTLQTNLAPNALLAYWNLMVHRNIAETIPYLFTEKTITTNKVDNGFFYKSFNLNKKI